MNADNNIVQVTQKKNIVYLVINGEVETNVCSSEKEASKMYNKLCSDIAKLYTDNDSQKESTE